MRAASLLHKMNKLSLTIACFVYLLGAAGVLLLLSSSPGKFMASLGSNMASACICWVVIRRSSPSYPPIRALTGWVVPPVVAFLIAPFVMPTGWFSSNPAATLALSSAVTVALTLPPAILCIYCLDIIASRYLRRLVCSGPDADR